MTSFDEYLFEQVGDARRRRDWVAVDRLLRDFGAGRLAEEPELAIALAIARSHMLRDDEAALLLDLTESRVQETQNEDLYRRWLMEKTSKLILKGKIEEASDRLLLVTSLMNRARDEKGIAMAYNNSGILNCYMGRFEEAIADFTRCLAAFRSIGDHHGVAMAHYNIGLTLKEFDQPREALPYISLAQDGWLASGLLEERTLALAERAVLATTLEDLELGNQLSIVAVEAASKTTSKGIHAVALRARAISLAATGHGQEALDTAKKAILAISGTIYNFASASIREESAAIAIGLGNRSEALQFWREADAIYSSMGAEWWRERMRRSSDAASGAESIFQVNSAGAD